MFPDVSAGITIDDGKQRRGLISVYVLELEE